MVCVDANISLKLFLPEPDRRIARALWAEWTLAGVPIVAPTLWAFEVTSVIRNRVHRQLLPPADAEEAFAEVHQLPVQLQRPENLHRRAWELANRFGRPAAYDSHYLALAEIHGCPFWTADQRLFRVVQNELPWVRYLGDYNLAGSPP